MKKKNIFKYLLAFIIPFTIISVYFFLNNKSLLNLLISDLNEQYVYLFKYLKNVMEGTSSLFYSFSKGLGGSMYGTFFYYLSSPLNLLLALVPYKDISMFIGLLIFIKIGLCGLTMYVYLAKSNNNSFIINLIFSTSYALMMYNIVYFFDVMWLDVVYLSSLVILGLDRILENRKSILYVACLFLSIISNYYIAYMLCIFSIIYVIYRLTTKYSLKKDLQVIKGIIVKFLISSLLAGILASFMILPVLAELSNTTRDNIIFSAVDPLVNISNFINQLAITKQTTKMLYVVPYFFCGYFTFVVLINYYLTKKLDKDKLKTSLVFLLFIASILLLPLIYIWHAFTLPTLFCYRFSFLISLFMIIIASEKYVTMEKISNRKIALIGFLFISIISSSYLFSWGEFNIYIILINLFLLISNFLIINIDIVYKKKFYQIALLILFIIEIIIGLKLNFLTSKSLISDSISHKDKEIELLANKITSVNEDNYRVGGKTKYQLNELFNSNSSRVQLFLSSINGNMLTFLKNVGYTTSSSDFIDNKNQTLINELLGIKYWYNEEQDDKYRLISTDVTDIYENKKPLSLGYMVASDKKIKESNPFEYQNVLIKGINNCKNIFNNYKVTKISNNKYELLVKDANYLYIYGVANSNFKSELYINDEKVLSNYYPNGLFKVNNKKPEGKIIIEIKQAKDITDLYVSSIDDAVYNSLVADLENKQIKNIKNYKNKMVFNIANKKDGLLMLTIPYERGFSIYVDGKKTEYKPLYDTFIGFNLDKGQHKIEITYRPKYILLGMVMSVFGLIMSLLYLKKPKVSK